MSDKEKKFKDANLKCTFCGSSDQLDIIDKTTARKSHDVITCGDCGKMYYFDEKCIPVILYYEPTILTQLELELLRDKLQAKPNPISAPPFKIIQDFDLGNGKPMIMHTSRPDLLIKENKDKK